MVGSSLYSFFFSNLRFSTKIIGVLERECIPFIPNISISNTPQQYSTERKNKKNRTPTTTETTADTESHHEPPKLIFPFSSTNENSKIHDSSKSPIPRDMNNSFVSKEDSIDGRYYLFKSTIDNEQYRLPSVTTVLQATLPRSSWFGLNTWRKNQIQEHGEEQYRKMKTENIRSGTLFHQLLEEKLNSKPKNSSSAIAKYNGDETEPDRVMVSTSGNNGGNKSTAGTHHSDDTTPQIVNGSDTASTEGEIPAATESESRLSDKNYLYSESVKHVLDDIGNVVVTEGVVQHDQLGYSGTVDCVAYYRNELCVIEWKTSTKLRPRLKDLYDYPLQIVAYAGAINNDTRYSFKVNKALIVVAYLTGEEAHAHVLDSNQCTEYWDKWLDRLNQFQTQFAHDLSNVHI